ncbi:hypothetical protein M885DRAFT_564103 [Pelagophyceae sp. CCMP2097]|nr:hypothetical protein M885DRAFT_564103 [Pelagophyceae sp. CCMP2097]
MPLASPDPGGGVDHLPPDIETVVTLCTNMLGTQTLSGLCDELKRLQQGAHGMLVGQGPTPPSPPQQQQWSLEYDPLSGRGGRGKRLLRLRQVRAPPPRLPTRAVAVTVQQQRQQQPQQPAGFEAVQLPPLEQQDMWGPQLQLDSVGNDFSGLSGVMYGPNGYVVAARQSPSPWNDPKMSARRWVGWGAFLAMSALVGAAFLAGGIFGGIASTTIADAIVTDDDTLRVRRASPLPLLRTAARTKAEGGSACSKLALADHPLFVNRVSRSVEDGFAVARIDGIKVVEDGVKITCVFVETIADVRTALVDSLAEQHSYIKSITSKLQSHHSQSLHALVNHCLQQRADFLMANQFLEDSAHLLAFDAAIERAVVAALGGAGASVVSDDFANAWLQLPALALAAFVSTFACLASRLPDRTTRGGAVDKEFAPHLAAIFRPGAFDDDSSDYFAGLIASPAPGPSGRRVIRGFRLH